MPSDGKGDFCKKHPFHRKAFLIRSWDLKGSLKEETQMTEGGG